MSQTTPATTPKQRRRAPRWLLIGFFISLALNLIVVGIAIGSAWHFRAGKALRDAGAPRHFGAFLRWLPSERRDTFRDMLGQLRPSLRPLRDKVRAARRQAEAAMAAEPFDREAFATANRKLHEARAELHAGRAATFVQLVEAMTAQERQLFLEWRRKHRQRWRRGN